MLSDTSNIDQETQILNERRAGIYSQMEKLVADNAARFQDQDEYQTRYAELNDRFESVSAELTKLEAKKQARLVRREKMRQFIQMVQDRENLLTTFDESLFRATVESITVYTSTNVRVKLKDGREVKVDSRLRKYAE